MINQQWLRWWLDIALIILESLIFVSWDLYVYSWHTQSPIHWYICIVWKQIPIKSISNWHSTTVCHKCPVSNKRQPVCLWTELDYSHRRYQSIGQVFLRGLFRCFINDEKAKSSQICGHLWWSRLNWRNYPKVMIWSWKSNFYIIRLRYRSNNGIIG